jgi:hypothetical protein
LRLYTFGIALDPLCLKPELLTACIIDQQAFDTLFSQLVPTNSEGVLISGRMNLGIPFTETQVMNHLASASVSLIAKACLTLAWRYREELGLTRADERGPD